MLKYAKVIDKVDSDDDFYSLVKLNRYMDKLPLLP